MTPDDDDIELTRCEQFGHIDEEVVDEDDGYCTYRCRACGAEWWDD
jgi:uncharacterized Zn finger protein